MEMSDVMCLAISDRAWLVEQTVEVTTSRPATEEERVAGLMEIVPLELRDEIKCNFHAAEAGELIDSDDTEARVEFVLRSSLEDRARYASGWEGPPRLRSVE